MDAEASLVGDVCHEADVPLNNNQLGIALFAAHKLTKDHVRRQIFQMPTGSGKSHVICGLLAALALSQSGHYGFRVVYTTTVSSRTTSPS